MISFVDHTAARGGRKKGGGGGSASGSSGNSSNTNTTNRIESANRCIAAGLGDCAPTCCLVGSEPPSCAPYISDANCATYYNKNILELYIGFGTVFGVLIFIPLFIKVVNCLMLVKFCKSYDEMSDTWLGGYSICDLFS